MEKEGGPDEKPTTEAEKPLEAPPAPPAETPTPPPPPPAEGEAPPPAPGEEEKAKEVKPKPKPRKKPPMKMLLFDRWDISEVVVHDAGLNRYINLTPIVIPHTGARWANKPFGKAKASIVERVINNMMRTETFTGKKAKAYRTVRLAFEAIEQKAKKNPVQVLIEALEKAAPREEVTRLKYGGISVPKAVDVAPSRRLDLSIRNICQGAVHASFKNKKSIEDCLADEILAAARGDMSSAAISRKEELERVASSAR